MDVTAFGYVGIRTKALEDWAGFGTGLLGMQLTDKSRKSLALRMDDRKQRVVVTEDGGTGAAFSAGRWRRPPRSMRCAQGWKPTGWHSREAHARSRRSAG